MLQILFIQTTTPSSSLPYSALCFSDSLHLFIFSSIQVSMENPLGDSSPPTKPLENSMENPTSLVADGCVDGMRKHDQDSMFPKNSTGLSPSFSVFGMEKFLERSILQGQKNSTGSSSCGKNKDGLEEPTERTYGVWDRDLVPDFSEIFRSSSHGGLSTMSESAPTTGFLQSVSSSSPSIKNKGKGILLEPSQVVSDFETSQCRITGQNPVPNFDLITTRSVQSSRNFHHGETSTINLNSLSSCIRNECIVPGPSLQYDQSSHGFIPLQDNPTQGHGSLLNSFDWNCVERSGMQRNTLINNNSQSTLPLFPSYGASSSQNDQANLCGNNARQILSLRSSSTESRYHNGEQGSMVGNPFYRGVGSHADQVRELLLKGPIDPTMVRGRVSSQWLLKFLDDGDLTIRRNILSGVLGSIMEIMTDQYGCSLFQKLLYVCDNGQKQAIVCRVTRCGCTLVQVAKCSYGFRSVKTLIRTVKHSSHLSNYVASALATGTLELMFHSKAYLLIAECFVHLQPAHNRFLFKAALKNFHGLAIDAVGYRSLIICIDNSKGPHREQIADIAIESCVYLANDSFGNFVVQHSMTHFGPIVIEKIWYELKKNVLALSMQRYGSYIIEKCLKSSAGKQVLQELVHCEIEKLEEVAGDPYGNFVLQAALDVLEDDQLHDELVHIIIQLFPKLVFNPYAKNLLKRVTSSPL